MMDNHILSPANLFLTGVPGRLLLGHIVVELPPNDNVLTAIIVMVVTLKAHQVQHFAKKSPSTFVSIQDGILLHGINVFVFILHIVPEMGRQLTTNQTTTFSSFFNCAFFHQVCGNESLNNFAGDALQLDTLNVGEDVLCVLANDGGVLVDELGFGGDTSEGGGDSSRTFACSASIAGTAFLDIVSRCGWSKKNEEWREGKEALLEPDCINM